MSELFDRADEIFAALTAEATESETGPGRGIGIAEVAEYLMSDEPVAASGMAEALLASPALRRDYMALMRDLAEFDLPVVAAAADPASMADSAPLSRVFGGGVVELRPSVREGVFFLTVTWQDGVQPEHALLLHLEWNGLPMARLPLPAGDGAETTIIPLSSTIPLHAEVIAGLREPRSRGYFLPLHSQNDEDEPEGS